MCSSSLLSAAAAAKEHECWAQVSVCVCVLAVIYNSICLIDFNLLWCYYTQPTADAAAVGAVGGNVLFHPLKTTAHITDDEDLVWRIRSSISITNISINGSTESVSSAQFSSILQTHNLLTILEHLIALEHHSPLVITAIAHYCWLTTLTTAYFELLSAHCSCRLPTLIANYDTHSVQCVVNRQNSQLLAEHHLLVIADSVSAVAAAALFYFKHYFFCSRHCSGKDWCSVHSVPRGLELGDG